METRRKRLKRDRKFRERILEVRVLPQSLHDVLDDPHTEVSGFNFVLCALDLQVHLSSDQPLQVPEKLLILDVADPSIDRWQFMGAGDRGRRGGRARGTEWGCGNRRER